MRTQEVDQRKVTNSAWRIAARRDGPEEWELAMDGLGGSLA
jgi:hypothetical protein